MLVLRESKRPNSFTVSVDSLYPFWVSQGVAETKGGMNGTVFNVPDCRLIKVVTPFLGIQGFDALIELSIHLSNYTTEPAH